MSLCRVLRTLCFVLAAACLAVAPAVAEGPAVESPNGKLAFDAGRVDGESLQLFDGSFAFPIGEHFGGQLDGATGLISEDDFVAGVGGQLFWRDPELALVGVEAAYADRPEEDLVVRRFGAVSEFYRERFTARGQAGYQRSDIGNGGYASLDFIFYAGEELALRLGGAIAPGKKSDQLSLGFEYQPRFGNLAGLSLFVDGGVGKSNFESVQGGVRYYFDSQPRSLMDRQRRQDPSGLADMMGGLTQKKEDKPRCPVASSGPMVARLTVGPGRPIDPCAPPPPPPCPECT